MSAAARQQRQCLVGHRAGLLVEHHPDRFVGEILGEVVAVLGSGGRLDEGVVPEQFWRPLVGVAAKKAVEAFESRTQRPVFERPGAGTFAARDQMPFAHRQRAPARVTQHAWQGGRRARNPRGVARIRRRQVGEEPHADRVMVAAGQQCRPGGRTQRGHMKPVVPQAAGGQSVNSRRGDIRTVATKLGKPEVVEQDHDDVGGAFRRLGGLAHRGYCRGRLARGARQKRSRITSARRCRGCRPARWRAGTG